uniref:Enoyl-CoA delta isomerase 1, mitochondrial n=1 Tax=Lygus hesperus TaxID=30085 RepID=A0A0A9XYP7_LYGHE
MLTVWINLAGVSFGMSSPTRPGIRVQRTHTHTHTRRHPTKTVAAINGHAIAAGTFLAAACDIRVALDNPKYLVGLNEVSNGFCIPYRMLVVCQNAFHSYSVAQQVLLSGKLLSLHSAALPYVGFIHQLVTEDTESQSCAAQPSLLTALYRPTGSSDCSAAQSTAAAGATPLIQRAVELAHVESKSLLAYRYTKKILQKKITSKVEKQPHQTILDVYR